MKVTNLKHLTISLVFACTGLFVVANLNADENVTEEILIQSSVDRTEIKDPIGSSVTTQINELSQLVDISDLDLSIYADVEELHTRIAEVAQDSCKKLSEMYPLNPTDLMEMNTCVKRAIASATEQKEKAIASSAP